MIYSQVVLPFAGLSFVSHIIVLGLLIKQPKLRKQFGDVIVVLCVLGLMYDVHWLTLSDTVRE